MKESIKIGNYEIRIRKTYDSFNGLVYRNNFLIGCVAAGLKEGRDKVIEKAKAKFNIL